jgi:hypothetical protein
MFVIRKRIAAGKSFCQNVAGSNLDNDKKRRRIANNKGVF